MYGVIYLPNMDVTPRKKKQLQYFLLFVSNDVVNM